MTLQERVTPTIELNYVSLSQTSVKFHLTSLDHTLQLRFRPSPRFIGAPKFDGSCSLAKAFPLRWTEDGAYTFEIGSLRYAFENLVTHISDLESRSGLARWGSTNSSSRRSRGRGRSGDGGQRGNGVRSGSSEDDEGVGDGYGSEEERAVRRTKNRIIRWSSLDREPKSKSHQKGDLDMWKLWVQARGWKRTNGNGLDDEDDSTRLRISDGSSSSWYVSSWMVGLEGGGKRMVRLFLGRDVAMAMVKCGLGVCVLYRSNGKVRRDCD